MGILYCDLWLSRFWDYYPGGLSGLRLLEANLAHSKLILLQFTGFEPESSASEMVNKYLAWIPSLQCQVMLNETKRKHTVNQVTAETLTVST